MATSSSEGRSAPTLLFRGDSRPPAIIFKEGFQAKGGMNGDTDVVTHVLGGENLRKTGLISTSQSLRIPPIFMQPLPINTESGAALDTIVAKTDGQIYTKRGGWIYHIKPTSELRMTYVPDMLSDPKSKALYAYQQEWAVQQFIPPKNIKGAQRVQGYVRRHDLFDGRGPFLESPPEVGQVYHEWHDNPNYQP